MLSCQRRVGNGNGQSYEVGPTLVNHAQICSGHSAEHWWPSQRVPRRRPHPQLRVLRCKMMHHLVREHCAMIAAASQCAADGAPRRSPCLLAAAGELGRSD